MRPRPRAAVASVLVAAAVPSVTTPSRADDRDDAARDPTHGRIEGDATLVVAAGATFGPRDPRPTVGARMRYLSSAGIFAAYEDGSLFGGRAEPARVISVGGEWRPLFLGRWFLGKESGVGRVDLALDAVGLEVGAYVAQPQGRALESAPGLQLGVVLGVPLLPRASGPWISARGGLRVGPSALEGAPPRGPADRALYLSLELAWETVVLLHLVDRE